MARMTLKQAMAIEDLRGKSREELMDILAPIRDAANKRLGRLAEAGQTNAPAFQAAMESGGKIYGSKFNSIKDLQSEIERGQAIIRYKTSTVSGAKQFQKRMTGKVPKQGKSTYKADLGGVPDYGDLSGDQITAYWKIMDKLGELGQTGLTTEMYNTMKALIRAAVNSDDPVNEILNRLPAASHEAVTAALSENPSDDPMDNILNAINSYLDWRTEHGYLGKTNTQETDEDSDFVWL